LKSVFSRLERNSDWFAWGAQARFWAEIVSEFESVRELQVQGSEICFPSKCRLSCMTLFSVEKELCLARKHPLERSNSVEKSRDFTTFRRDRILISSLSSLRRSSTARFFCGMLLTSQEFFREDRDVRLPQPGGGEDVHHFA
jgi:hypothetical protein